MADWTIIFLTMTGAMVFVCALASRLTPKALEVFGAASVIALFTMGSRMVAALTDFPWSAAHYGLQDLLCVWLIWLTRKHMSWWKAGLMLCLTVQCGLHAAYWATFLTSGEWHTWARNYLIGINALFGIEVLIVTMAGGGYVAAYIGSRLGGVRSGPLAHARGHTE